MGSVFRALLFMISKEVVLHVSRHALRQRGFHITGWSGFVARVLLLAASRSIWTPKRPYVIATESRLCPGGKRYGRSILLPVKISTSSPGLFFLPKPPLPGLPSGAGTVAPVGRIIIPGRISHLTESRPRVFVNWKTLSNISKAVLPMSALRWPVQSFQIATVSTKAAPGIWHMSLSLSWPFGPCGRKERNTNTEVAHTYHGPLLIYLAR